jgi:hypothetical protein
MSAKNIEVKQEGRRKNKDCAHSAPMGVALEGSSVHEKGESKRKRSDNDQVQFIAKRPRKEIDFHLREMEKDLGWGALKYAKEGNE